MLQYEDEYNSFTALHSRYFSALGVPVKEECECMSNAQRRQKEPWYIKE